MVLVAVDAGLRPPTRARRMLALVASLALVAAALAAPVGAGAAPARPHAAHASLAGGLVDFGCANPANRVSTKLLAAVRHRVRDGVTCFGKARAKSGQSGPLMTAGPVGIGPAQIQSAYKLGGLRGNGRTVGIVDAYDDPKAESDLARYRAAYGLPACTTANGCFRKMNQNGKAAPLPAGDFGWALEISLDLDAVSAACPDCHILVEANTPNTDPLMSAVDTAVRLGAVAVSNSYGGAEATPQSWPPTRT